MAETRACRFGREEISPPFSLILPDDLPSGLRELHCQRVYRHLPRKRLVCSATWAGKEVFVKIYYHRWRARTHWRREERGLRLLERHGIAAPPVLQSRYLKDHGCYVLILGAIAPARTFDEAWKRCSTAAERQNLLVSMAAVFGDLHRAGLMQSDPHFRNFLVSGDRIWTLDGSDIGALRPLFARRQALRNLAAFFAILRPEYIELADAACIEYFNRRGWACAPGDREDFIRLVASIRERNNRDYLKRKIFRECTPFAAHRSWNLVWACDRRFCTTAMQALLRAPDEYIRQHARGHLKRGRSATVAVVDVDDVRLVVKHYHARNPAHAIRRAFGKTRAARSWSNAHRLRICGIATAEPLAWVEKRFGPFRRSTFFMSRYVAGPHLADFLGSATVPPAEKTDMAEQVVKLLESLRRCRIVHGDLKATNLIAHEGRPVLLDLDAMRHVSLKRSFTAGFAGDIKRFLRNWEHNEPMDKFFRERLARFLDAAGPGTP